MITLLDLIPEPEYIASSLGLTGVSSALSCALCALMIVALWFIFRKAGQPGWAAIVPFYDLYILFKIVYGNGWKFLLLLIPVANVVVTILCYIRLGACFGKSNGFKAGLALVPIVFLPILAFDKSIYGGIFVKG